MTDRKRNQAYHVIEILKRREPVMHEDLMHELGIRRNAASRHLRELHALDLIYISSWDRVYQQWVPVYRWGTRSDMEKPVAYTNAEMKRRQKQKARAQVWPGTIGGAECA